MILTVLKIAGGVVIAILFLLCVACIPATPKAILDVIRGEQHVRDLVDLFLCFIIMAGILGVYFLLMK